MILRCLDWVLQKNFNLFFMKQVSRKHLILFSVANIAFWTLLLILIEWKIWPSQEEHRSLASILFQSFFMGLVFTILGGYLYMNRKKKPE